MKKFVLGSTGDEIDYYIEQLRKEFGEEYLTPIIIDQFRRRAKNFLADQKRLGSEQQDELFDFAQSFLQQHERRKELAEIQIVDRDAREEILERHFEDRAIAKESVFRKKGAKTSGLSVGYIARKQTDLDGLPFMIKKARKSGEVREDTFDAMNLVNEFVTAPLYKRTLYDRTPIIAEVNPTWTRMVAFRSKFLHDFKTIAELTGGEEPSFIGPHHSRLKHVEGAEKVFAAMFAWGEYDIHAGNVGVMKIRDKRERSAWVLAKIDHGWSATEFFTNPSVALENFADAYLQYGYQDKLPLDVGKFKAALDEITSISDEEIEWFIKAQTDKLRKLRFNLKDLMFEFWEDEQTHSYDDTMTEVRTFDTYDDLESFYIDHFKKQMVAMRKVSERLDIISKIDGFTTKTQEQAWKKGRWIQDVRGMDPVKWAQANGKTIEGLRPYEWARQHGKAQTQVKSIWNTGLSISNMFGFLFPSWAEQKQTEVDENNEPIKRKRKRKAEDEDTTTKETGTKRKAEDAELDEDEIIEDDERIKKSRPGF